MSGYVRECLRDAEEREERQQRIQAFSLWIASLLNHASILEQFIVDELEVRECSFEPNPNEVESVDLKAAELALEAVRELKAELQKHQQLDTFAAGSVEWGKS